MSRRGPAKNTQAEYDRIFRAAVRAHVNVSIEYAPDGKINRVSTTGKASEANAEEVTDLDKWMAKDARQT